MRTHTCLHLAAVAAFLIGCGGQDGAHDAGGAQAGSLVEVGITFTRDARGTHLGAQGHFARFRAGEVDRAATLLGLDRADAIPLDGCQLVDVGEELDRAFSGGASADVELLDAGRIQVKGPVDAMQLQRRRYPELTPEVAGVVYGAAERATLSLEPGAMYEVTGDGGEEVGPFSAMVVAPRAFPSLAQPMYRRGGDLELRWADAGDPSDPLLISVMWTARSGARELRCRVRDDGAFTVPGRLLASLPPAVEARAEVTATRLRRTAVDAPGTGRGELVLGLREVASLDGE